MILDKDGNQVEVEPIKQDDTSDWERAYYQHMCEYFDFLSTMPLLDL